MSGQIVWDAAGSRSFEAGVDRCVLYIKTDDNLATVSPYYNYGVAWNGVTGIDETSKSDDPVSYYYNGTLYATSKTGPKEFGIQLTAYTYPDEFARFDGYEEYTVGVSVDEQPNYERFHLCYRTRIGNDVKSAEYGYKLHILYNMIAQPTVQKSKTLSSNYSPDDFAWDMTGLKGAVSVRNPQLAPAVHIVLDSRKIPAGTMKDIEETLYGTESRAASLPDPDLLARMLFMVTVNEIEKTARITGSTDAVDYADFAQYNQTLWRIRYPSVTEIGNDLVRITDVPERIS